MNERIESLTIQEAIFYTTVQSAASRLSIPAYLCQLYGWGPNAEIMLEVERRGTRVKREKFAMTSGYEIVPKAGDEELRKILKPGARVKVTIEPLSAARS